MAGSASFSSMSRLPRARVECTATRRLPSRGLPPSPRPGTGARRTRSTSRASRAPWPRTSVASGAAGASEWRRFASPICAQAIRPPLTTSSGREPKNAGRQSTRSASLPDLDRPDLIRHPMCDRGVDRVLRQVAPHAQVVVVTALALEPPALHGVAVRRLPGARDRLADAPHGLAVARDHRDRAKIVQARPRPRSSRPGCGSRRRPRPRGCRGRGGGRP